VTIYRRFRTALSASAALAATFALWTAPASAFARDADVGLYYKVYVGGFHVGDLNFDIGLRPRKFDVEANIKSTGMIGRMFPWSMKAYSNGAFASGGGVNPVAAGQTNNWRGKERFIDLSFENGVAQVKRIQPTPDADDRDRVSEDLRTGALDLTSAIMTIITRMDSKAECTAQVPVFDGRRRFDLVVEPDGVDRLKPNRYSPFGGETTNCIVWMDKKAGFKKRDSSGWNDSERKARVWMGRAFGDAPPVPVRLTFDTPFGALIAHLNKATMVSGENRQELSQAD
jgi:hypothetical protein